MTTAPKTSVLSPNLLDHGKLLLTSGIQHWLETGCEPYLDEPRAGCLDERWRRHYISVIVTSHIHGDGGDTSADDVFHNIEAFAMPGTGRRVFTVWHRNNTSKIYAITTDFGGPDAYLTVMFAEEY